MLEGYVSLQDADEVIIGGHLDLLEKDCVKIRPEKVLNYCIDENVNLDQIKNTLLEMYD